MIWLGNNFYNTTSFNVFVTLFWLKDKKRSRIWLSFKRQFSPDVKVNVLNLQNKASRAITDFKQ